MCMYDMRYMINTVIKMNMFYYFNNFHFILCNYVMMHFFAKNIIITLYIKKK
jgi:hypothetical protein